MGFGTELFEKLEKARAPLVGASRRLVSSRLFPLVAPEWMVNQYHLIRATVPTLSFMIQRCQDLVTDLYAQELEDYFVAKLFDERGHDLLLLQDLERLGKRREAEAAFADPDVAAWVGSQYYLAQHNHPAAYLGFITVLEAFPPSQTETAAWAKMAGFPASLKTAALHSAADLGHREDLRGILDLCPESLRPLVEHSALQCIEHQRQAILTQCRRIEALEKNFRSYQERSSQHGSQPNDSSDDRTGAGPG